MTFDISRWNKPPNEYCPSASRRKEYISNINYKNKNRSSSNSSSNNNSKGRGIIHYPTIAAVSITVAFVLFSQQLWTGFDLPVVEATATPQSTTSLQEGVRFDVMEDSSSADLPRFRAHQVVADEAMNTRPGKSQQRLKIFILQESAAFHAEEVASTTSASPWRTLSFREVAGLWQRSPPFAEMFAEALAAVPYEAVFWESKPVTRTTLDKPYWYAVVDSPELASVSSDGSPFADYIAQGEGTTSVVSFRNLRRDALLVVPCRAGRANVSYAYAHLAAFVRSAPRGQVIDFFKAVGAGLEREVASRDDESPVWLSTSGLGVFWLHARLDSVPKYYTYKPFKTVSV